MRYLARGGGTLQELNDLRGPMSQVLDFFVQQQKELAQYKAKYGPLSPEDEGHRSLGLIDDGSDTEQEK